MKKHLLFTFALLLGSTAFAQTGGPDSFGYSYINSNHAFGPIYNWIELDTTLGGTGTWSTASDEDDSQQGNIPISFDFPFYGITRNSLTIGSNGTVYFSNYYLGTTNVCLPNNHTYAALGDTSLIALFWDDLNPSNGGDIYYQDFGTYFVVEFSNVVEFASSDGDTWEVILYDNGNVRMQYKETSAMQGNASFTVGMQGGPTLGLGYLCDGAGDVIEDNLAILWSLPLTGISESDKPELSIFPNPNNGEFTFAITSSSNDISIKIADIQGRAVYTNQFNTSIVKETISLDVAAGMYYVTVNNGLSVVEERIIVQ